MQIHVSFDYELFFGGASGTVQKCMIEPTQQLLEIAEKHGVSLVFFVDAGYLCRLKDYLHIESCRVDYLAVSKQLNAIINNGHELALHIHPHWEDSCFTDGQWKINTSRYKLADFGDEEIQQIMNRYHHTLREITGKSCRSYRAGGWCIQPFAAIGKALAQTGIFTDSTVYYKGYHASEAHRYDFRKAPDMAEWHFDEDPCLPVPEGKFLEIPVTPDRIPPFFYWKLYLKMRIGPSLYRPVGDGQWLADRKRVYRHFYHATDHFACADGFFASRLKPVLKRAERDMKARMMILSHPKSMAPYSFKALDEFITFAKARGHRFDRISSSE